jgi:hypothetical protein
VGIGMGCLGDATHVGTALAACVTTDAPGNGHARIVVDACRSDYPFRQDGRDVVLNPAILLIRSKSVSA